MTLINHSRQVTSSKPTDHLRQLNQNEKPNRKNLVGKNQSSPLAQKFKGNRSRARKQVEPSAETINTQ